MLTPHEIVDNWGDLWPILEAGERLDDDTLLEGEKDVLRGLILGDRRLVKVGEGLAMITLSENILEINCVSGQDIRNWGAEMDETITSIAKSHGCKRIVAVGRKGWIKIWRDYRETGKILFMKEV